MPEDEDPMASAGVLEICTAFDCGIHRDWLLRSLQQMVASRHCDELWMIFCIAAKYEDVPLAKTVIAGMEFTDEEEQPKGWCIAAVSAAVADRCENTPWLIAFLRVSTKYCNGADIHGRHDYDWKSAARDFDPDSQS